MGAEYLILGQHYIGNEITNIPHVMAGSDSKQLLTEYTDCIAAAMKTGKFTYVAHPDMFYYTADDAIYRSEVLRLCETAKQLDIPLEINLLGIHDNRIYPNPKFWKIAAEVGNKVIFSMDAHSPDRVFDSESVKKAEKLVKKFNLNLIDRVEIKGL